MLKIEYIDNDYSLWRGNSSDLVVIHNGNQIARHTDRMEPEDVMWSRDLSWIKPLLEKVYQLGIQDEKDRVLERMLSEFNNVDTWEDSIEND